VPRYEYRPTLHAAAAVSVLLVATSVAVHYVAYRLQVAAPAESPIAALRWFDVNSERNVPTAWSAALLLASAVLAAVLALRRDGLGSAWLLVAATAGYLALDESIEIHEWLAPAGSAVAGNALHFAWVIPGAALAAVVGGILLARLRRQPEQVRRRLVIAGGVYLTGALLLEALSGIVLRYLGPREMYIAVTAAEELCEMLGASLLLATVVAVLSPRLIRGQPRRARADLR
jgi:hypothetical protein